MDRKAVLDKLVRLGRWCADFGRILITAFSGMGKDNITIIASGMVYSTLIAFVPCLTFLFSFLSAFGVSDALFEIIGNWLVTTFGADTGGNLVDYLSTFSQNAMSLGIVGLGSFIVSAILLVNKIYTTINQIFHTRPTSSTVQRFSTFLTFLIVVCFLIGVAFILSRNVSRIVYKLTQGVPAVGNAKIFKQLMYSVIGFWILFMIYKFVPRAKISMASAAAGAVVCMIGLWAAVKIFGEVATRMVSYSVIYGSMASLFIALLFLYISWYIILFCAELVYVHQFRPERSTILGHPEAPAAQISSAVSMILLISDRYRKGKGAMSLRELMAKLGVPSVTLNAYLSDFEDAKIIMPVNTTKSAYVPAKPLDQILVVDIINVVYQSNITSDSVVTIGDAVASDFLHKGLEGVSRLSVRDLLERI